MQFVKVAKKCIKNISQNPIQCNKVKSALYITHDLNSKHAKSIIKTLQEPLLMTPCKVPYPIGTVSDVIT